MSKFQIGDHVIRARSPGAVFCPRFGVGQTGKIIGYYGRGMYTVKLDCDDRPVIWDEGLMDHDTSKVLFIDFLHRVLVEGGMEHHVARKAVRNCTLKNGKQVQEGYYKDKGSPHQLLMGAFTWGDSPEGSVFWCEQWYTLSKTAS